MKTGGITGSSRGLGFEMAQRFRKAGLSGVNPKRLEDSKNALSATDGAGGIYACGRDVSHSAHLRLPLSPPVAWHRPF